ncbi:MAG: TetR family transcriptional regulator, partial [Acidimicrobiales bacterium]|nr:TetR family transcriptional regulator [Acidimicrobiales bacterium]
SLIDRHYGELRAIRFDFATQGSSIDTWLAGAIDAWFAHVEKNPFAGRMLFRDTTGDPKIAEAHREIQLASRGELLPLLEHEADNVGFDLGDALDVELIWETMRAVLQGLAAWWYEHPDVPRQRMVTTAMNAIWVGFERVLGGEAWRPPLV